MPADDEAAFCRSVQIFTWAGPFSGMFECFSGVEGLRVHILEQTPRREFRRRFAEASEWGGILLSPVYSLCAFAVAFGVARACNRPTSRKTVTPSLLIWGARRLLSLLLITIRGIAIDDGRGKPSRGPSLLSMPLREILSGPSCPPRAKWAYNMGIFNFSLFFPRDHRVRERFSPLVQHVLQQQPALVVMLGGAMLALLLPAPWLPVSRDVCRIKSRLRNSSPPTKV